MLRKDSVLLMMLLCVLVVASFNLVKNSGGERTPASIDVLFVGEQEERITKHVRGEYMSSAAIMSVEGDLEQVHPNTLCSNKPHITFGRIYLLKHENHDYYPLYQESCQTTIGQVGVAVNNGATAVIVIATGSESNTKEELEGNSRRLSRPVIVIDETTEEDKLLTILSSKQSVYARITPMSHSGTDRNLSREIHTQKERLTYIGVTVIFSLLLVLAVTTFLFMLCLRERRRKAEHQRKVNLLKVSDEHKVMVGHSAETNKGQAGQCPICLRSYKLGQEMRVLPCAHRYHKQCLDRWLSAQGTCPCCCGQIVDLHCGTRCSHHKQCKQAKPGQRGPSNTKVIRSWTCSQSASVHLLTDEDSKFTPRDGCTHSFCCHGDLNELVPSPNDEMFACRQYEYLLHRLQEVKCQRPSSSTPSDLTETLTNKLDLVSSVCSTFATNSSLPCHNNFIGDGCQGGVPQKCDIFTSSDVETDDLSNLAPAIQYMSSKSTYPSVESVSVSPRVSELEELGVHSSRSSLRQYNRLSGDECSHRPIRMVRFTES